MPLEHGFPFHKSDVHGLLLLFPDLIDQRQEATGGVLLLVK